ncbi:MAG: HD-GYP domain-containing protein [Nitrospirota bacterium]
MNNILSKKLEQLNTLIELSFLINSTLDTREIRRRAIEAATRLLDAEAGSLLLIDQETGELFFEVALGEKGEKLKEIRLKKGEGIAGWVAEEGEPVIIHDVQSNHRFLRAVDEKSTFTTRNMVCVPVKTKDKVIGVLEVINKRHDFFNEDDKESLTALANQVAIAIENANLYQELKEAFYSTAMALAEAIEKRDPYTGEHTKRVMDYSAAIGRAMGLSKKELEDLKLAAILHDVGKIGVRDNILLKGGKLEPDELEKMNMHSKYGAEILSHVKQLKYVVLGVRGHHERLDGKGYPDNLKDGDIPIIARIVAVADTFDAMTTDRPYRKALSFGIAFEELRKNIETQFDGEVVEAFIRAWRERDQTCLVLNPGLSPGQA